MIPELFRDIPRELIERFEQTAPAATAFPPAVNGHRLTASQYGESLRGLRDLNQEPVGLYVHIPFCPVRCLYCACHTTVTHDAEKIDQYLDDLAREMDLVADGLGRGRALSHLHLGGGTPNYLSDSQLIRLIDLVEAHFRLDAGTVTSIECNPKRASAGQLELLRALGFRHLSLGIQELDPAVQRAIGRINSPDLIRDVCATARAAGFEGITLDLVYGLPNQSEAGFRQTLEQVVTIAPDRVRCYSYSHQPVSRPHQHAIDPTSLPTPAEKLALLHQAVRAFTDSGYRWIGVDCFAREGDTLAEAQLTRRLCHTGIGYTSTPIKHLVACGVSSLGEVDGAFVQNETGIGPWRQALAEGRFPISWGHKMSESDRRRRDALRHLMCHLELPASLARGLEEDYERLGRYAEVGLMEVGPDRLRVTPRGRYFLRSLCTQHAVSVAWSSNQWGAPRIA